MNYALLHTCSYELAVVNVQVRGINNCEKITGSLKVYYRALPGKAVFQISALFAINCTTVKNQHL